jgi:hypothetical protein
MSFPDMSSEAPSVPPVDATNPIGAQQCTLEEFFLQTPPGSLRSIKSESLDWRLVERPRGPSGPALISPDSPAKYSTQLPGLKLHCSSAKCGGSFWFKIRAGFYHEDSIRLAIGEAENRFIEYICKSCDETRKIYAVRFRFPAQGKLLAYKFGEHPDYGPPLPAKVLKLVQSDADLFKKGWKAEKLGFGVCAFTYYRRIVENHRNELFDKIIEIAEDERLAADKIDALRHARDHSQFSRSIDEIKEAIPESLKMFTHNPLLLLHDAFSKGVHELSDEQCLQRAHAVRTILIALADRFALIRAENEELKQAISSLFKEETE